MKRLRQSKKKIPQSQKQILSSQALKMTYSLDKDWKLEKAFNVKYYSAKKP